MKKQKICIIGDGLTGLTTCLSLKNLNLDIDFYTKKQTNNNIDRRITAISDSNYNFLKSIEKKINPKIFWSCNKIKLHYESKNSLQNFLNFDDNNKNLMHIFENKKFKNELFKKIRSKNVKFKNTLVTSVNPEKGYIEINKTKSYYDLIILCLGPRSPIYEILFRNRSIQKDYSEVAITGYINHNSKLENPEQYFLKEGPLAFLPFNKKTFSFVWSLDKSFYLKNKKFLKNLVLDKIESLFNKKYNFKVSEIQSYPIFLNLRSEYSRKNTLVLGEGLHSIHPIAGQGFNLVLRDIKKLNELIAQNLRLGLTINNSLILKDFYSARKSENTLFGLGVDLTNSFFKQNIYLNPLKEKILQNICRIKTIKKFSKIISDEGIST
jgi:2-octaprenyl-6-methoxyphenol hydroxylase